MGMFDEFNYSIEDDVPEDPWFLPENTYACTVQKAEMGISKNRPQRSENVPGTGQPNVGLTITFAVDEGEFEGSQFKLWRSASPYDDRRTKSFLLQTLTALGIPRERVNTVEPDDLVGRRALVTTVNRNGFVNVQQIEPMQEAPAGAGGNPFEI